MKLLARPLIALVHAYQWLLQGRPSPCRYVPSCSNYALEALEVHGAVRGTALTVRRLARCHPWGGHGWDPVPPSRRGSDAAAPVPAPRPSPHTDKACR